MLVDQRLGEVLFCVGMSDDDDFGSVEISTANSVRRVARRVSTVVSDRRLVL